MVGIQLHATVGEKGQIVIPKPIRDMFQIRPFSELVFDVEKETILIKKKQDNLKVLEEYLSAVKTKKTPPKKIDWDALYYSQYER